ncbi:MAG: hypothetical protein KGJ30_15595 [Burkholderiales bacterium]|nr:hypothetical protein [Burkholderiales bacterium]
MDFKTQLHGAQGLAGLSTDALVVLVAAQQVPADLEPALAAPLAAAVKAGDFEFKAGKTLYAHRVEGVKAARVVFAAAGDASPKALAKAVAAAVAQVKGGGAKQISGALAGGATWTGARAEALVGAASDAVYV